jgi:hypothetical protein
MKSMFIKKTVATDTKTDYDRPLFDLANDVRQKRKLIEMLFRKNKILKLSLLTYFSLSIIFFGGKVLNSKDSPKDKPEVKTFNCYYSNFIERYVSAYGLGISNATDFHNAVSLINDYNIIIESKMLLAIASIDKNDYNKAIYILSEMDTQESEWLLALCLFRIDEKEKAGVIFRAVVEKGNLFAFEAEEIVNKYYN